MSGKAIGQEKCAGITRSNGQDVKRDTYSSLEGGWNVP